MPTLESRTPDLEPGSATMSRQSGFSLIELMISLALGLIILAALGSMMVNQSRLRAELDRSTRMISNGTYAIKMLADEYQLAGYYDAYDPTTQALPVNLPDPCSIVSADIAAALRLHVQGVDAATTTSVIGTVPGCVSSKATGLKPGSDILVIRRVDTTTSLDPATLPVSSKTHYLQASLCSLDMTRFLLSDAAASLTLGQKSCLAPATPPYALVRPFHVSIYFVDANNRAGDGIPTLKMVTLQEGVFSDAVPLVEGIEFLQVEYGLDANNDGVADSYSSCSACTSTQWASVVSVKMYLVAKSQESSPKYVSNNAMTLGGAGTVGPYHDAYKRGTYSQTVRLINPASRRETP